MKNKPNILPVGRRHEDRQAGFTLLLAALVSSIVLALGAAIFAIAQKELILSSVGRNSQFAFYAADSAAECALYHDVRFSFFATSTPPDDPTPKCDGQTLKGIDGSDLNLQRPAPSNPNPYPYTMSFQYQISSTDLAGTLRYYCAQVSVTKSKMPSGSISSTVRADGFSTPCATITSDSQSLQRSVELRY